MKAKLPTIKELRNLLIALKPQIADDYRATDDSEETLPGMCVTIGANKAGNWNYQTGDNSFTGGAYSFPYWAVVYLYRRSDSRELARDARDQLAELMASDSEE